MSAVAPSPAEAAPFSGDDLPAVSPRPEDSLPQPGDRWRGVYQVREQLPESTVGRQWRALRVDTAEEVILRALHVATDDVRRAVWQQLCIIDSPHLVHARGTESAEDCHVEIAEAPRGVTLAAWRAAREEVGPPQIESFVRQLSGVLSALHGAGLVHLGLNPKTVFVREESGDTIFTIAALESVTRFERDRLIPAPVDPFYAPPEAAGLFQHSPGLTLRAWDWWSLGRLVQELILGRHVLGHMLDREVWPATPEMQAKAEAILLQRDAADMRPGAVEAMPAQDKRIDLLLRGLLAAACDGRWGRDETERWLRHEPVKHRYLLARTERLFRLNDRPLTVPEAADALRTPDLWAEILPHAFNIKQTGTLAYFLDDSTGHRTMSEKHAETLKLAESDALRAYPADLVREVVAAIALQHLAGNEFVWRGRRMDAALIGELLNGPGEPKAQLQLARLLTQRFVVLQVQRCDGVAAQMLGELGGGATEAEALAVAGGWLAAGDSAAVLRLWQCALASLPGLQAARTGLRQRFACSTNAAMNRIFQSEKATRAELIVVAWAARDTVRFGFVTHQEWARRKLLELRATGEKLATALFWQRLAAALRVGAWLFARRRVWVPLWAGIIVLGLVARPGPRWLAIALLPAALAAVWRVVAHRGHAARAKQFSPTARPWGWRDSTVRCRAEAEAIAPGLEVAGLLRLLNEVNTDIAKLKIEPPPPPIALPPRFTGTWVAAAVSWLFVLGVVAGHGWEIKVHPPSLTSLRMAWTASKAAPKIEEQEPIKPIKVSWPHKAVGEIHVVELKGHVEATPEQRAYALAKCRALVEPYKPETITLFIAIRVPTETQVGLMMFNGKTGSLVNQHVYLSSYEPLPRMWIELSGEQAIYIIP